MNAVEQVLTTFSLYYTTLRDHHHRHHQPYHILTTFTRKRALNINPLWRYKATGADVQ